MKQLKRLTWVFLQGDVDDVLELFAKNDENKGIKTYITQNFEQVWPI